MNASAKLVRSASKLVSKNTGRTNGMMMMHQNIGAVRMGGSFLNVDVHKDWIAMDIDMHQGNGTHTLDSIPLSGTMKPQQDPRTAPDADLAYLKDVVRTNDVQSVLVSWRTDPGRGQRIAQSVDSFVSGSSSTPSTSILLADNAETMGHNRREVTTTRPFFMLDGGGRRVATLCVVKDRKDSPSLSSASPSSHPLTSKLFQSDTTSFANEHNHDTDVWVEGYRQVGTI